MGYMSHHAIVVTSYNEELIIKAHKFAKKFCTTVTEITPPSINGYRSFMVAPDGSKEGWEESEQGNLDRDNFIEWLNKQQYEDGSSALKWVEVMFGDDDGRALLVRHNGESE